jgi:hypothetical protein
VSDITRREAVTLAAAGVAAAAVTTLAGDKASAAVQRKAEDYAAVVEKTTANLVAVAGRAAAAASTPEDAYKRFMSVAGKGMMQVMADALASAVSGALEATKVKRDIEGWEKFVKGCVLSMDFGAPIDIAAMAQAAGAVPVDFRRVLVTKLQDSVNPTEDAARLLGGRIDITVGGHWDF